MKKIILTYLAALVFVVTAFSQQEPHYTMYMFNKLTINPAYAGSKENFTMFGLYRHQWLKIDGAPRTFNFSMHTPFMRNRNGIGLTLVGDEIGITSSISTTLSYAYRLPVGENKTLSFGLQGQYDMARIRWDETQLYEQGDDLIQSDAETRTKPNFGAGIYFATPKFYLGVSMPQFFVNNLYEDVDAQVVQDNDFKTYYLMTGCVLPISKSVKFQPSVLFTHNPRTPFEMDLNANFVFLDALWVGASWRHGDSWDAIIQYQFAPNFRGGMAFDFTSSELRKASAGGFELLLEYIFVKDKEAINHIRFF